MGAKEQKIGALNEARITRQLTIMRRKRICAVRRVKPPMNIVGNLGKGLFKARHSGTHTVDYEGTMAGGRAVYFDAKHSTGKTSFSFGSIRDNQIEYLQERSALGAVCFFLVSRPAPQGRTAPEYVVPIDSEGRIAGVVHKRCALLNERTRESVKWSELEDGGWRCGAGETWVDVVVRQSAAGLWR